MLISLSVIAFLSALGFVNALGLVHDLDRGVSQMHLIDQIMILALSLGLMLQHRCSCHRLQRERQEVEGGRNPHSIGAADRIDATFQAWSLTKAESCVAWLLLQGLSHQEIADACNRSERTVRQQAIAVYRKSGVAGRAELSALFLKDLLLPPGETARSIPRDFAQDRLASR